MAFERGVSGKPKQVTSDETTPVIIIPPQSSSRQFTPQQQHQLEQQQTEDKVIDIRTQDEKPIVFRKPGVTVTQDTEGNIRTQVTLRPGESSRLQWEKGQETTEQGVTTTPYTLKGTITPAKKSEGILPQEPIMTKGQELSYAMTQPGRKLWGFPGPSQPVGGEGVPFYSYENQVLHDVEKGAQAVTQGPSTKAIMAETFVNIGIGLAGGSAWRLTAGATGLPKYIYSGTKIIVSGTATLQTGKDVVDTAMDIQDKAITASMLSYKVLQYGAGFAAFGYGASGRGFANLGSGKIITSTPQTVTETIKPITPKIQLENIGYRYATKEFTPYTKSTPWKLVRSTRQLEPLGYRYVSRIVPEFPKIEVGKLVRTFNAEPVGYRYATKMFTDIKTVEPWKLVRNIKTEPIGYRYATKMFTETKLIEPWKITRSIKTEPVGYRYATKMFTETKMVEPWKLVRSKTPSYRAVRYGNIQATIEPTKIKHTFSYDKFFKEQTSGKSVLLTQAEKNKLLPSVLREKAYYENLPDTSYKFLRLNPKEIYQAEYGLQSRDWNVIVKPVKPVGISTQRNENKTSVDFMKIDVQRFDTDVVRKYNVDTVQKYREEQINKNKQKQSDIVMPVLADIQLSGRMTRQGSMTDQAQKMMQELMQDTMQDQTYKSKRGYGYRADSEELSGKRQISKEGFNVYIKDRTYVHGKKKYSERWKKANPTPLSENAALSLGATAVDQSAAASFKIRPAQGKAGKLNIGVNPWNMLSSKFYKNKGTYIESTTNRIDSPGEIRGISALGWIANQNRTARALQPMRIHSHGSGATRTVKTSYDINMGKILRGVGL